MEKRPESLKRITTKKQAQKFIDEQIKSLRNARNHKKIQK